MSLSQQEQSMKTYMEQHLSKRPNIGLVPFGEMENRVMLAVCRQTGEFERRDGKFFKKDSQ